MLTNLINNYYFWLISISLFCCLAERIKPWRKQSLLRPQFFQDMFWLVFNVYLFGLIFKNTFEFSENIFLTSLNAVNLSGIKDFINLQNHSLIIQILIALTLKDFIEWLIHNCLHRINFLWKFHQLHHSIKTMDWAGNTRYHFIESFVYKLLKYVPLLMLQVSFEAIIIVDVFSTLIGDLNHSNLKLTWGPLKYIFNSPTMHIWHHDKTNHFKNGQNFGIVFSFWDWIFKTAYLPKGQPIEIGFSGEENYPTSILKRLIWPIFKTKK